MTLIKSISGIRGTIGGKFVEGLSPLDIVIFTSAYGVWLKSQHTNQRLKVVIGRDARISGEMVKNLVIGSLQGLGIDVIDLGLSTSPTVEVAVENESAHGGIILTASHNPKQWNALKLLNNKGEFISASEGQKILEIAEKLDYEFADVDALGKYTSDESYIERHINMILSLPLVDIEAIKKSVTKTKRLVVADPGWHSFGAASEIITLVSEDSSIKMSSNPIRITLPDSHTPMSQPLENNYYIKEEDIVLAIKKSLK